jgi:hypothetical protein
MSKARQKPMAPQTKHGFDGEPPEFGERRDYAYAEGKRVAVVSPCNRNCDRIEWLFSHKSIERRQYDAAQRLMQDLYMSQITSVASAGMGGGGSGGLHDPFPNDTKVDAMRRHGAAREALGRNWAIVEAVVEQNMSVEKASAAMHVHRQTGMGMLYAALHFLADTYGVA